MSRQDKSTTERNARILRDLVKQPDNKNCADCRKNDARWASWNIGVFLCIRCSGIHRAMGTHISKVKSIDLDIWTPEQMESIQKWGNRRANLYWERHLKPGHIPPDHKIESFIRSKYESRRWAMNGPPPSDPRTLENGTHAAPASPERPRPSPTVSAPPPHAASSHQAPPRGHHPLLSRQGGRAQPAKSAVSAKPPPTPATAPIIDFFGEDQTPEAKAPVSRNTTAPQPAPAVAATATTTAAAPSPGPAAAPAAAAPDVSIFDLDFKTPSPIATSRPQTNKADIMSLFSQPPAANIGGMYSQAPPPARNPYSSWGGGGTATTTPAAVTLGPTASVPTWGAFNDSAAWGQPVQAQPPQVGMSNQWAASGSTGGSTGVATGGGLWGTSPPSADPWATTQPVKPQGQSQVKDDRDPFANIWS